MIYVIKRQSYLFIMKYIKESIGRVRIVSLVIYLEHVK